MIVQVESPPSSLLLQKRVNNDNGEEFIFITQINNVHYTELREIESYFNEVNKGGATPSATKRIVDSNFVIVPMKAMRSFMEHSD